MLTSAPITIEVERNNNASTDGGDNFMRNTFSINFFFINLKF